MTHRRLTHLCVIASLAVATIAPLRAQETAVTASGFVEDRQGAHVIGAFVDSLKLVMFEHGIRIAFQEKTRSQLGGPFWLDYSRSVHIPDHGRTPIRGRSTTSAIQFTGPRLDTSGSTTTETLLSSSAGLGGTGRREDRRLPGPPPTACNSSTVR